MDFLHGRKAGVITRYVDVFEMLHKVRLRYDRIVRLLRHRLLSLIASISLSICEHPPVAIHPPPWSARITAVESVAPLGLLISLKSKIIISPTEYMVRGKSVGPTAFVSPMKSIRYPNSSPNEANASRWCQKKARDCQRFALTAKDPKVRLVSFNLAKMWREMADDAEQETVELSKEIGAVINFPSRAKS
jgi:hypothetical protein